MLERMNPLPQPGNLRVQTECCKKMVDATAVVIDTDRPFVYFCDNCKTAPDGAMSIFHVRN